MSRKIKNLIDALIMIPLLGIGAIICIEGFMVINIPFIILSFPIMVVSASRLKGDIEGNFIDNSIFSVSRNGKITQDTLRHPLKFLKILGNKNKKDLLIYEEFNMFKQLKRSDSKGNIINYNTLSQGLTVKLLKDLKRLGYIENLEYIKSKKSNLFFEKLLIGNNSKSKNKKNMYNITFKVTDKKIDDEVFLSINEQRQVTKDNNDSSYNPSMELQKKIDITTREDQIEELKKLRESLVDNEKDDTNYKTM